MKKYFLFLFALTVCGCSQQQNKKLDPKDEFAVEETMINSAIYELKSKDFLDMQFPKLDTIIKKFPNTPEARKAENLLNKKDSLYKLIEIAKQAEKKANSELYLPQRKDYQEKLRNFFLDQGFDIKVKITGEAYNEMVLEFALFNDVWFRKFETNGSFDEWFKMGFTKITLSNNYDYNKYKYIKD